MDPLHPTITVGATGPAVSELQQRLGIAVTGTFDDVVTGAAVRAFQTAHGLQADTYVGTATWTALGVPVTSIPFIPPAVPNIPKIDLSGIAAAIGFVLPFAVGLWPPIGPFVPVIQGLLNAVTEIQASGSSHPQDIVAVLLKHLPDVLAALQQHQKALAAQPPSAVGSAHG